MCWELESEPKGLADVLEIGLLNFGQLLRDCRVVVIKDEATGKPVPLTRNESKFDCDRYTKVQWGQHEGENIRGIGRITWITDNYDLIWEGQIEHNDLNGFARTMCFYKNGVYCDYMGHWNKGKHHGYGRVTNADGSVKEGFFENGKFVSDKIADIQSYDETDPRAQKIDYERYLITLDTEFGWNASPEKAKYHEKGFVVPL